MKKTFDLFLDRVRECQSDLSVSAFSRSLGLNQKTVDLYLKGERKPSVEFVVAICSSFDVSADWLLGLTDIDSSVPVLSGSAVTANNSAIRTGDGDLDASERARLLGIIESQQAVIAALTGAGKGK